VALRKLRKQVSDKLGQFSEVIKSWMKALTYTRNICAHHARLWDRFFVNKPRNIDLSYSSAWNNSPFILQAYIIIKLMNVISPTHHWRDQLRALLNRYDYIQPFNHMGFEKDWQQSDIWHL